jgi:hypothetical protein
MLTDELHSGLVSLDIFCGENAFHGLTRSYPDGVSLENLADWHGITCDRASELLAQCILTNRLLGRREGGKVYVWRVGAFPFLLPQERRVFDQVKRVLLQSEDLWLPGLAMFLGHTEQEVVRMFDLFKAYGLVEETAAGCRLTLLGKAEGM